MFYIVWGKKLIKQTRGEIADFCPFCREIRRMKAAELRIVPHVYYIPTGRGDRVANEITCKECRTCRAIEPTVQIAARKRGSVADVVELAFDTAPRGSEWLESRLEMESRRQSNAMTSEERKLLLLEPLLAIEYLAERELVRGNDRSISTLAKFLAAIGLVVSVAMVVACFERASPTWPFVFWTVVSCTSTMGLLGWAASRMMDGCRRITKSSKIAGPIARSWAPLAPALDEIERAIKAAKEYGCGTIGRADPMRLHAAIGAYAHAPR